MEGELAPLEAGGSLMGWGKVRSLMYVCYTMPMTDQKQTVLLVEDAAPAAFALGKVLGNEGFEVILAGDGEEGLKVALEKHPDIILADLKMPKMGGMEMIRELHKDPWGASAEIIILTNVSDVETLEEAMSQNTFYYLVKSDTSMADIVTKIRARLAARGKDVK